MRLGIAGLGYGAMVQIPAFRAIPGVEVVAMAAARPERARAVAASLGAKACRSLEELLDQDLQAVSLALPPAVNPAAIAAALDRGLDVLSEKPLGADVAALADLPARAGDRVIGIDFALAELDWFLRLRQLVDERDFGRPLSARLVWHARSRAWAERRWCWKTDARQGGGALTLYGSHLFYMLELLFGPIVTVSTHCAPPVAAAFAPPGARAAADQVRLRVEHAEGMTVEIEIAVAVAEPRLDWQFRFAQGEILIDYITPGNFAHCRMRLAPGGRVTDSIAEPDPGPLGLIAPFGRLATRFVEATRQRQPMHPGWAAGLRVQRLLDAAERSAAQGQPITL